MTKATQLEQAIQDSLPVVGDSTVAVSLINGLGNDDNLFKVFPKERCIIGSSATVPAAATLTGATASRAPTTTSTSSSGKRSA